MAETGKKIIITVLCVILMCAAVLSAVLYTEGYYDFTFIDRKNEPDETEIPRPKPPITDAETDGDVYIDEETEPPVTVPDGDEYIAEGYIVSGEIYNGEDHIIAKLPISLPKEYKAGTVIKPSVSMKYDAGGVSRVYEYSEKESDLFSSELYMGYIISTENGKVTVYSPNGDKLIETEKGSITELVYMRNRDGLPIFRIDGADCIIKDGKFEPSKAYDIGLYFNYPAKLGAKKTLYAEKIGGRWVYKTTDGDVLFDISCDKAYNFSEGYGITVDGEELYCYNEKGREVFTAFPVGMTDIYGAGSLYFDDGYVMVRKIVLKKGAVTEDYNVLVNYKGTELPVPVTTKLVSYSNQRMLLEKDGKLGFYAIKNDWITDIKYTYATPFCEGLAVVGDKDGKKGVIDLDGNTVVPFEYDRITECSDGVFLAYNSTDGWCAFGKLQK
ncbi:MAG: WG repeat-containing protein [Clostridia bacterium]|nr:WG repeat-containing protein [Clostridia bacterium]